MGHAFAGDTADRLERTWPLRPGRTSLARHGQAGLDTLSSSWELRCGPANQFRVFYELAPDAREVWVLAIGVKDRDRLFIAGKEFEP